MLLRSHFIRKFCAEPAAAARLKLDGWAESVRKSGKLVFVTIGDGKQIVVDKELAKGVQVGSPISAIGRWQKSQGDQQEMELVADAFEILGHDSNPRYSADVSADNARKKTHLRARHPEFAAILRSRSLIARATRDFFERLDFVNIDAPKLTRNDAEGGGECFEIKGASTFLTVSSQLHLEAMAAKLERVYTLGTAFRAEKQQSHAHLSEFYMLEAEIAFVQSIDEMCDLIQAYIQTLIHLIEDSPILKSQIAKIGHFRNPEDRPNLEKLLDATWPRIRYEEALEILKIPAGSSEGGGFFEAK
ncbi:unnamed protein product [Caenorhabditis angaria]|uniref:Aminoacyl-transfer RNA synthetases class-II family profile domain-containing protein n=1 Tax=Caenorhabditis angaria TaxID=860376 RepID=A0A9P1IG61_9PELO|nr:unnamed protein product [Caenorhabditis angaria]